MVNTDDDEWEYEYDDTETEDFYVPLDLSNVPRAQVPIVSQGRPGHPTLLKSRLRALNAAQGQPTEFSTDIPEGQDAATMGELQVIGLHTPNPLVMYNDQLLSCQWTSTIGTDMFFVKPNSNMGEPLRTLPSVDLLSLGSAKLVAKVGTLRPRDDLFDNAGDAQQGPEFGNIPSHTDTATTPIVTDPSSERSTAVEVMQPAPTSFLAKLNEAKAQRGEKSRLAISKTRDGCSLVIEGVEEPSAAIQGVEELSNDTPMGGT